MKKNTYLVIGVVILILSHTLLLAEPVTINDAEDAANFHLLVKEKSEEYSINDMFVFENTEGKALSYIANFAPFGFIALSTDTDITPIIAYSFNGNFPYDDDENNILYNMLKNDMELRLQAIADTTLPFIESNNVLWDIYLGEDLSYLERDFQQWPPEGSTTTGGWVETAWYQTEPYNNFCPLDPVTYDRCVVGCIGTALAQIINYHQYIGNISFNYYNDGYITDTRHINIDLDHAIFDFPDFENLNNYLYNLRFNYINNIPSQDEIAALNFTVGITLEMDYTSSSSGSSPYVVSQSLLEKFNYNKAEYEDADYPEFYDILSQNMVDALPALLGISLYIGGNHAVVCDGYNTDDFYHLNYGWVDNPDPLPESWYTLPDGYPFAGSAIGAILNIEDYYGTVEGIVTISGHEPGSGNEIYIRAESFIEPVIVQTMEDGYFIIQLEPGVYNLTASCYGYNQETIQVEVVENEIQAVNFDLTTHNPETIIVDINGGGNYTSIQEGINNAVDSDIVLVNPGIYEENINFNGKLITVASRYLITGEENYINETIIDGNFIGSVVTFENQEDERAILCGLTIINGIADNGGGIYCDYVCPRLEDLIITQNVAEFCGGGIYVNDYSDIEISNVRISNNKAYSSGGGIFCDTNSYLYLIGVDIFYNNVLSGSGGGIAIDFTSSVEFTSEDTEKCNIYLNHATQYGNDLYYSGSAVIQIIVDTFTVPNPDNYFAYPVDNYIFDISNYEVEQVDVDLYVNPNGSNSNCGTNPDEPLKTIAYALAKIISQEISPLTIYLSEGVFSYSQSSEVYPINCRGNVNFVGDSPRNTILDAEDESSIIYCYYDNDFSIENMTIKNGFSIEGAGIYCNSSSPNLTNLFISENNANYGAGFCCSNSSINLINITINGNTAMYNGGSVYCAPSDPPSCNLNIINSILWNNIPQEIYASANEITATYSDIQDGTGQPWFGEGCIDVDPLLVQEGNHLYHLLEGSPCIDTGDPDSDLDPDGTRADMGCYPTVYDVKKIKEKLNWVSFPKLDRDGNDPVYAPDVLQNIEPFPTSGWIELDGRGNVYLEYIDEGWIPHGLSEIQSTSGYKLVTSNEDNSYLPLSGTRLAPDTQIYLYADQENWIGYFLPYSQSPEDAFAQGWDNFTYIKADSWGMIRSSDEEWKGSRDDLTVDYGKLYIVGVERDMPFFTWNDGGDAREAYTKTETSVFSYEEESDYMMIFVDSTGSVAGVDEIGVFLDDECVGASVVEEYPVFIPAYVNDDSTQTKGNGELTFQTATYGKSTREQVPFYVYDNLMEDFVEKSVRLNTDNYAFVRLGKGTGISYPDEFIVYQNYPNPMRNKTTISFILPKDNKKADIKIYNIKGQLVKNLEFRASDIGFNAVWDCTDNYNKQVSSGIYFYKVTSGNYSDLKKMLLIR